MDGYKIPDWANELHDQIKAIIRIDEDSFIVFINKNNEIDWKTSDDYDKKADENGWELINSTSSKINFLRSRIPTYLSDDLRNTILTLLGEATVSAFHDDRILSEKILSESENKIGSSDVSACCRKEQRLEHGNQECASTKAGVVNELEKPHVQRQLLL